MNARQDPKGPATTGRGGSPRIVAVGIDKLVMRQRLRPAVQISSYSLQGATQERLQAAGRRAQPLPQKPATRVTVLEGSLVRVRFVPVAGGWIHVRLEVDPEQLHRAPRDAWDELQAIAEVVGKSYESLAGEPPDKPVELYEIHLHVDVWGCPILLERWKRELSERCGQPLRTTEPPSATRQGIANRWFHIYAKLIQAQELRTAAFIFDVWRANGWDGGSCPVTRFEAVLDHHELRRMGFANAEDIDLAAIWQATLDRLGVADGTRRSKGSIRGLPAQLLRSVTFTPPWDTAPGLVVPSGEPTQALVNQAVGSFVGAALSIAMAHGVSPTSFEELTRYVTSLALERRPELATDLDVEILVRRARKGLSPGLRDLVEVWLDRPLDQRPPALLPADTGEAILHAIQDQFVVEAHFDRLMGDAGNDEENNG